MQLEEKKKKKTKTWVVWENFDNRLLVRVEIKILKLR